MASLQPSLQTSAAMRAGSVEWIVLSGARLSGGEALSSSITSQRTSKPSDSELSSAAQISAERGLTPIRAVGICHMPARAISTRAPWRMIGRDEKQGRPAEENRPEGIDAIAQQQHAEIGQGW